MFVDNTWYSHRRILAEYCKVDDVPILGSIQHGVQIEGFDNNLGKHKIPYARYFCWGTKTYDYCKKNNVKNVIPIGAPFLYLDQLTKSYEKKSNGTICFPAHSNPTDKRFFQHELFINFVMDNFPPPYTACLFFLDFNDENCSIYKNRGWEIVTAGDRSNPLFLNNLYFYISKNEFVVCTELGTSLFYSMYLNKKCSYSYKIKVNGEDIYFQKFPSTDFYLDQLIKYKSDNKFLLEKIIDPIKSKKLADEELGLDNMKDVSDLKNLIGYDSFLKKFSAKTFRYYMDFKYKGKRNWK